MAHKHVRHWWCESQHLHERPSRYIINIRYRGDPVRRGVKDGAVRPTWWPAGELLRAPSLAIGTLGCVQSAVRDPRYYGSRPTVMTRGIHVIAIIKQLMLYKVAELCWHVCMLGFLSLSDDLQTAGGVCADVTPLKAFVDLLVSS